jgi:hypothetical protein
MQVLVWSLLYWLLGVVRVGYSFFDFSDINYYYQTYITRMAQGLVPFRDFFIEYPPLFAILLAAPGSDVGPDSYRMRFAVMMILLMAAACGVTAGAASSGVSARRPFVVAAVFSGLTLLLGPIAANRYDPAVTLLLAVVLLFLFRRQWGAVAVTIGVGFALKITPAMLLPLVLLLAPRERIVRMLAWFTTAATVPFVWVALLGKDSIPNLSAMFSYHFDRPLEIESVLATPFWIGKLLGITSITVGTTAGSQVIMSGAADMIAKASTGLTLAALGLVFALVWRRRQAVQADESLQALAVLATLLASLVGSKVLSPQYFVWVLPAVAIVALDRRGVGVLLAAVLLLTHVLFPANYVDFAQYQLPGPIAVVVVRNLLLLVAFAISVRNLWQIPQTLKDGAQ